MPPEQPTKENDEPEDPEKNEETHSKTTYHGHQLVLANYLHQGYGHFAEPLLWPNQMP